MDKVKNRQALEKFCKARALDLFGVAEITGIKHEFVLSQEVIAKVNTAIVLGARLSRGILADVIQAPTRLYFHHYRTVNAFLDQAALALASHIQNKGFFSLAIPASQIVDWEKQTAHLSHRKVAQAAGIGWIGRNNLLVNKKFGSQFRLVTVLTDMPLKADKPAQDDCGTCRRCARACPANAIGEDPGSFDFGKCFSKLKEFQKQHLVDQYVCGVCVRACSGNNP